ncbi:trithorax group protein osa-like isoform X3 [Phlebotomus papatasi]|uniref:trithorax group protein osa-like isoform X3 n=2 Tax=Phlebotomus papatasi TaxID=29031 RepID=UPI0024840703|nr:trithorax group protein osa-like isoform X3 [Phlebotomus papatasi]
MPQRLQGVNRNRNVLAPTVTPYPKSCKDLVTKEIVINDAPVVARNLLTKGQTQDEISQNSGASISTRGRYIAPAEKNSGKIHERPLYLYIQAHSKHSLDLAVQKISQIIQMEGPHHQRMPKFGAGNQPMPPSNTCVEKIMIGLEHAPPAFDLRGRLIGVGGANLHYIRNETGAMATLRGRGSMFLDPQFGQESPEPLHLYIEHLRPEGLQAARQLAKNLIETLQQELIQFQQMNPPATNIQYHAQSTVTQSSEQQIYTPQQIVQMGIPPPIIAVPPPVIQGPTVLQQQSLAQPASQIVPPPQYQAPQNPAPTPTIQSTPQHSIIQHSVPIQLHPNGNVMIQQQVQTNPPTLTSINLPPPGVHIPLKSGSLVQVQAAPPMPVFSQPPPNIQLQQQPPPSQIILNQAPPNNYQYQYIQQQPQLQTQLQQNETTQQQGHVTIQHIYQPQPQIQPQIQRIIHQNPTPQPIEQFQQIRPSQQYITLQGNTAYVVPPPNIVQQAGTTQPAPNQPNVVFSTQLPPPQTHQEIAGFAGPNAKPPETSGIGGMPMEERKFESKSPEYDQNKLDRAINDNAINKNGVDGPPVTINSFCGRPPVQQNTVAMTSIPIIQAPPPIMSIPPPGIHQIIGNTYLTTAPSQQENYNATPVSIHQIQPPPQQSIHVPTVTAPTQHHVVLNHSWQPPPSQIHHITQANQLQNVQISHQIRNPASEIIVGNQIISAPNTEVASQHNSIITTLPPAPGMQVQFQPPPQPQPQPQQQQQPMPESGPPPQFGEVHTIPNSLQQRVSVMHQGPFDCPPMEKGPKGGAGGGGKNNSPQNACFSPENAQKQMGQMPRIGMKRKHEDEPGSVSTSPRIGMGNSCGDFIVNVRETQKTGCPETTTSSGNGSTNNTSGSPSTTNASASTYATDESKMDNGKTVNKVPMLMNAEGQPEQMGYSSGNYLSQQQAQQQRYMMDKNSDFGGGGQGKNDENYGPPQMPMRNEFRPNMRRYMGQDPNAPMMERGAMIPPPPHPGVFNRSGNYGGYPPRFRSQ